MTQFTKTHSLLDRLAVEALMQRSEPGDYLVLSDRVLLGAIDDSRALRESEWKALLASPLTMRRLQVLAGRHAMRAAEATSTDGSGIASRAAAANQDLWAEPSIGFLRAAAGSRDDPLVQQMSDDERWILSFIKSANKGWKVVLKLNPQADHAEDFLAAHPEVGVLDNDGNTLLLGQLDEDGELEGPWRFGDTDPRSYLASHGHRWSVERV